MTTSFLVDEHVPSVFVTTLRSNGYPVVKATQVLGHAASDERILEYCAAEGHLLVTHDKKDFGGTVGQTIDHPGIVIYTDPVSLRNDPEAAVRTLERVLEAYPPDELRNERIWLGQWRP